MAGTYSNDPYIQGGLGLVNAWNAEEAQNEARNMSLNQYDQAVGRIGEQESNVRTLQNMNSQQRFAQNEAALARGEADRGAAMQQIGRDNSTLQSQMAGVHGQVQAGTNQLGQDIMSQTGELGRAMTGGYAERSREVLAQLEGMGNQARKDIGQQYDSNQGKLDQDLRRRGIGGTTVSAGVRQGNERERAGSLGRLDEMLRTEKGNALAKLRGDQLNNMQTSGDANISALQTGQGMTIDAQERLGNQMGQLTGQGMANSQNLDQGYADMLRNMNQGMNDQDANDYLNRINTEFGMGDRAVTQYNELQYNGPPPGQSYQYGMTGGQASVPATSGPTPNAWGTAGAVTGTAGNALLMGL